MRFYRPKSIRRLLLVGFVLVVLPLMVALIHSALSVERLIVQGQRALFETVRTTRDSQLLVEVITAMERSARQFQVLEDVALLQVYQEKHKQFLEIIRRLSGMNQSALQRQRLSEFQQIGAEVYDAIVNNASNAPESVAALSRFDDMSREVRKMLIENRKLVQSKVRQLDEKGTEVHNSLLLQASALVPAALLLAVLFTFLIVRPLQRLERAIRRLGDGDFSKRIRLTGPRDIEQLGDQLDWMRLRLLEVEQEKNRFLRHISHELKTPLTAIREGAELISEEVVGSLNSQQREIAAILNDSTIKLQKLIEDLLDFNMASSRRAKLNTEMLDLREVVDSVLADHKIAILARQLVQDVSLQSVEALGDREKLRTMLDNLLSNAIKFSPEAGCLRVSLMATGERAVIEVGDSGVGIPDAERHRVFDAFYQSTSAAKTHVRGTGVGLSIAREYVQTHDGQIEVVDSDDKGACVRVTLPIRSADEVESA